MEITRPFDAATEAGLFLEITSIARRSAARIVGAEDARDIAQEVVLECLIRLREGTSPIDLRRLHGLVRRMARVRAFDLHRGTTRRMDRDGGFLREISASVHLWMSPDAAVDDAELTALRARTLAGLSRTCRAAYTMVREGGMSYLEAARRLGLSRASVHAHVAEAQRRFRHELREQGVSTPRSTHGGTHGGKHGARQTRSATRRSGTIGTVRPRPAGLMTLRLVARSPPASTLIFSRRSRCRQRRETCCNRSGTWRHFSMSMRPRSPAWYRAALGSD
jgi:DNA-directed RNA polymerase specialized sigma24 family protein